MSATTETSRVRFSHVHLYCKSLRELSVYKRLEAETGPSIRRDSHVEDVVEEMVESGMRVTGFCETAGTRSMVLSSSTSGGLNVVVTAGSIDDDLENLPRNVLEQCDHPRRVGFAYHFDVAHIDRFRENLGSHDGVAALGFEVSTGCLDEIVETYRTQHPQLLPPGMPRQYPGGKVLEVFAHYRPGSSLPSQGTIIRFVEVTQQAKFCLLPGAKRVEATFQNETTFSCTEWVNSIVQHPGFEATHDGILGADLMETLKFGTDHSDARSDSTGVDSIETGKDSNDSNFSFLEDSDVCEVRRCALGV